MARLKKIFIVFLVGITAYYLTFYVLTGLKIKGYKYIFRATEPYDLVIKHAVILDGTGENEPFRGDIAIRDGRIAGVGYVNPKNSPVYDAGGLTIIPVPLGIEENGQVLEHLLVTSYPRYPAEQIFLQRPLYENLSLEQAACRENMTVDKFFASLKENASTGEKILLAALDLRKTESCQELLARLTGYRAKILEKEDEGCIREGCMANFYAFKTLDYDEESLKGILKKGSVPEPLLLIKDSKVMTRQDR